MDWILVICVALQKDVHTCGHVRRERIGTVEQCIEQRDHVAKYKAVAYAYCRPADRVELIR